MNDFKRVQIFCFFNDDSLENKIVYQLNRFLNIGFSLKFHNRCIPKSKSKMPNVQPLLTVHFFFSLKRSIANSICLFYTFLQKYFFSFWQSESTTCQKCERLFIHSQPRKSNLKSGIAWRLFSFSSTTRQQLYNPASTWINCALKVT